MKVANPIYDIVFKYMMEDERIARTFNKACENDAEMEHILRRLTMAAADVDMRLKMNAEEIYFSAIEKRDTEILVRDRQLAEKQAQLNEKQAQLNEQESMLRTTIKMLLDAGKSLEEISAAIGKDLNIVKKLATE